MLVFSCAKVGRL